MKEWSTNHVGERLARDMMQMAYSIVDLFVQARESEDVHQKEVVSLKKALNRRDAKLKNMELHTKAVDQAVKATNLRADSAKLQPILVEDYPLEVAMDEDDLPKVLAVLSDEVPDLGPALLSEGATDPIVPGKIVDPRQY
nr:uncharacterized protein LOC109173786 [Ipomoea trifida]